MSFVRTVLGGVGVNVSGGAMNSAPYINMNSPSAGLMRYNGNGNNVEVYDGTTWHIMYSSQVQISLDNDTYDLLSWARKKRDEERELERQAADNPTIKDLANKVKLYQDQIKMVQTLMKKDHEWVTAEAVQSAP